MCGAFGSYLSYFIGFKPNSHPPHWPHLRMTLNVALGGVRDGEGSSRTHQRRQPLSFASLGRGTAGKQRGRGHGRVHRPGCSCEEIFDPFFIPSCVLPCFLFVVRLHAPSDMMARPWLVRDDPAFAGGVHRCSLILPCRPPCPLPARPFSPPSWPPPLSQISMMDSPSLVCLLLCTLLDLIR